MSKGISRMMWIIIAVILIATVAIAAVAYTMFWAPQAGPRVLKIGVLAPLTGNMARDGQEHVYATQIAVDEINANGGVLNGKYTLSIVTYDIGELDPEKVRTGMEKLISQDKVDIISVGYGSQSNFEIDIAKDNNMLYLSGGDPESTAGVMKSGGGVANYPTVWMHVQSFITYTTDPVLRFDDWASKGYINFTHGKKFCVIIGDNPYSQFTGEGMRDNFTAAGWTMTFQETVQTGKVLEWGTVLAKIRADVPDLIIDTDYPPTSQTAFLDQFLQNPTNSYIFMQYGPSLPEFLNLIGDKSTGVVYDLPGFAGVDKYDKAREVRGTFYGKYGWWPAFYGLNCYDQVYTYVKALEIVGNPDDHVAIGNAIGTLDYQGANAHVQFDLTTHFIKLGNMPTVFYQLWHMERKVIGLTSGFPAEYQDANMTVPPWFD